MQSCNHCLPFTNLVSWPCRQDQAHTAILNYLKASLPSPPVHEVLLHPAAYSRGSPVLQTSSSAEIPHALSVPNRLIMFIMNCRNLISLHVQGVCTSTEQGPEMLAQKNEYEMTHTCGTGAPRRWCTTEEACCWILAHPQTQHRFSSLIPLLNCQYTVTNVLGFTNCKSEHNMGWNKTHAQALHSVSPWLER
jgi:hypothetical protein